MTGYGIGKIGESEVSAWELGSRSCRKPLISIMNLFALSTGFVLNPGRVMKAFYRGCRSKNLYYLSNTLEKEDIDTLDLDTVKRTHLEIVETVKYKRLRQLEFFGYLFISMIIHVGMLIIGKSLLIAESTKNRVFKKVNKIKTSAPNNRLQSMEADVEEERAPH